MKIIEPSVELINAPEYKTLLTTIEAAGRTCYKSEVVMTADIREWRHFLKLRCAAAAHPDMRVVANMLLTLLKQTYPVFFEDIES